MIYSSCLAEISGDLILDTSVIINLSASGVAAEVIRALPCSVLIVDVAVTEVRLDGRNGRSDADALSHLTSQGAAGIVTLDARGMEIFEKLVVSLDDGEAATIAAAVGRRAVVVLDERKARRICADEFPDIVQATSIDLFSHPAVAEHLGNDGLAEAVHSALKNARMSVRADQRDWIVNLIGEERAAECSSLPAPIKRVPKSS